MRDPEATPRPGQANDPGAMGDILGDRRSLLNIGMAAVSGSCVVFAAARLALALRTGASTAWWANAIGVAVLPILYVWYRRRPQTRSAVAVHGTAFVATAALLVAAWYGMRSSLWWLGLVGFGVVLLGRRGEARVWGIGIPAVVAATSAAEPFLRRRHPQVEPPLERALAEIVFVVLIVGLAAGFRRIAERRARALHASDERYRTLFRRAPVGVFQYDATLRITDCNESCACILGAERERLVGFDLGAVADSRVTPALRQALAGGIGEYHGPVSPISGAGEVIVSVRAVGLRDEAGAIMGAIGIVEDITHRERMEEELRRSHDELEERVKDRTRELARLNRTLGESEERVRTLLESLGEGVALLDPQETFLYCNPAAERIFGVPVGTLKGRNLSVFSGSEEFARYQRETAERAQGKSGTYEATIVRADGEARNLLVTITPRFDTAGTYVGALSIFMDITLRTRAEEALREREALYKAATGASADGFWMADLSGRLLDVNEAYVRRSGYSREELLGMRISDVEAQEDPKVTAGHIRNIIQDGSDRFETLHRAKDGSIWPADITSTFWPIKGGRLFVFIRDISERKRAENALRRNQQDLAEAQRLAKLGSWRLDFATGEAVWSGELYRIFDLDLAAVTPSYAAFLERVHPDDRSGLLDDGERLRAGGEPAATEFRIVTAAGEEKAIRGTAYPVKDPSGAVVGLFGTAQDVTERKQAETALRRANERIESVLASMTDSYALFAGDWRYRAVNPATITALGRPRDEIIGRGLWEVRPELVGTELERCFRRAMAERLVDAFEWYDPMRAVWSYYRFYPVAEGLAVFAADITARKQAEEALRASEAKLSSALAVAKMGHWEYDVPNDTFTFNDGFYAMLRTTAEREGGYAMRSARYAERFVYRDDAPLVGEEIRKAIETTDPTYSGELEHRIVFGDGKVGHIAVRFTVVKDEHGRTVKTYGANQDVTEQKRAEEALLQAQKVETVGLLAGGVAHDFNNVLQALLSQAQLLRARCNHPLEVEALGRELERHIGRGAALTRQLLLFSRRQTATLGRVDLNEAVQEAIKMLRRLVRANVAIETDLAPHDLPVDADRGQLDQVLLNLVVNGADSMPDGGRLTIRTGDGDSGRPWLAVEDRGHGIPAEIRERIFEPFFTTKGAGKGTGLGLSVVHGIVTRHGGEIHVDSTPGRGTTFRIFFPKATGAGDGAKVAVETDRASGRGNGERVLVVEDEPGARQALREILRTLGYRAVAVASGEEAGTLPVEPSFDVLLTDLMLPGVAGTDLAVGLRERWPGLRVIFMSGYTEDEAVRRGVEAGETRFLQKPFDLETLARELREALTERTVAAG